MNMNSFTLVNVYLYVRCRFWHRLSITSLILMSRTAQQIFAPRATLSVNAPLILRGAGQAHRQNADCVLLYWFTTDTSLSRLFVSKIPENFHKYLKSWGNYFKVWMVHVGNIYYGNDQMGRHLKKIIGLF